MFIVFLLYYGFPFFHLASNFLSNGLKSLFFTILLFLSLNISKSPPCPYYLAVVSSFLLGYILFNSYLIYYYIILIIFYKNKS